MVSFLAQRRTHTAGHLPSLIADGFPAGQHHRCDPGAPAIKIILTHLGLRFRALPGEPAFS